MVHERALSPQEEEFRERLAAATFEDPDVRRAIEKAYFLMARNFGWPDPEARDGDWYAALEAVMDLLRAKSPDVAAVYNHRLDRWLIALAVQRWVPDEWLDPSTREDLAIYMKGIARLPDRPIPEHEAQGGGEA